MKPGHGEQKGSSVPLYNRYYPLAETPLTAFDVIASTCEPIPDLPAPVLRGARDFLWHEGM